MKVYSVAAKSKDMEKYVTTKEQAAIHKNILPDEAFRTVRDDTAIIRRSLKVMKSGNHGKFSDKFMNAIKEKFSNLTGGD